MENLKICSKCGKEKQYEDFPFRDKSKGIRRGVCKECHNNDMKMRYAKKKQAITDLKSQISCQKCGEKRGYVLDFHHVDPTTKTNTVCKLSWSTNDSSIIQEEIRKCIVLCANCHREFHYLEDRISNLTLNDYIENNYNIAD